MPIPHASKVPIAEIQEGARLPFMSDDLRNSLNVWAGVIALVGLMVIGGAVVRVWCLMLNWMMSSPRCPPGFGCWAPYGQCGIWDGWAGVYGAAGLEPRLTAAPLGSHYQVDSALDCPRFPLP